MILRRLGNKKQSAGEIIKYFPNHKIYIEPFFGAGGMFFNKPKVKYNIVNDLDSDVFNLFQVVMNQKEELEAAFYIMPIHSDLLDYWKEHEEIEPVKKAIRFLLRSNFTYLGLGDNIKYAFRRNDKEQFNKNIDETFKRLENVIFNNCSFEHFFKSISFTDIDYGKPSGERDMAFIYCDPPYLETTNNYSNSFTELDTIKLFDCLDEQDCKYAVSEFDNPFILKQVKERNLNIHTIGERRNIKNRRVEILITNYRLQQIDLFKPEELQKNIYQMEFIDG